MKAVEAPANTSRAGRDLSAALGVAAVLAVVIIASLAFVKDLFLVVVIAAILVGLWELGRALAQAQTWIPLLPMCAGAIAMVTGAYYGGTGVLAFALAASVLLGVLWRMPRGPSGFVRDTTATVFCLVYAPFLASFVVLLLHPGDGVRRVITFMAVVAASDTGGYISGVIFGKHPMAPSISPKKTWEGFVGSAVACVGIGVLCVVMLLGGRWWVGVVLGAVVVVAATFGDLAESLIKRDLRIKDMSNVLPGHGGIMDRLDSLLAAVPLVWLVLHFWVDVTR